MPDKILTQADLAEIERLAIERLKAERKEEISKRQPNCHDCVYVEYQDAWRESRCELGEDWVGDGSFAEECEEFEYAWDDRGGENEKSTTPEELCQTES